MNREKSNVLTKILRTVGFLLFGVSLFLLVVIRLYQSPASNANAIDFYQRLATPVYDFLVSTTLHGGFVLLLCNVAGLMLLTWTLRTKVVLNVFVTIFTAYTLAASLASGAIAYIGNVAIAVDLGDGFEWLRSLMNTIHTVVGNHLIEAVLQIFSYIIVWSLFAYRKPTRSSTTLLRISMFIGVVSLIIVVLNTTIGSLILDDAIADSFVNVSLIGYGVVGFFGSLFGFFGFARD